MQPIQNNAEFRIDFQNLFWVQYKNPGEEWKNYLAYMMPDIARNECEKLAKEYGSKQKDFPILHYYPKPQSQPKEYS